MPGMTHTCTLTVNSKRRWIVSRTTALTLAVRLSVLLCASRAAFGSCNGNTICGDGVTDTTCGEECDDGGVCIGSMNAGTACTDSAQCPGGACKTFGGDGCAANCTLESGVLLNLIPGHMEGNDIATGTSGVVLHGDILTIPVPLSGQATLTIGKERVGEIPIVIKARNIRFPRINISFLACECVRPAAAKTCGGTVFQLDGVTLSPDCTLDDHACVGRKPCAFVFGAGNSAAGVIGCSGLNDINFIVTQDAGGTTGTSHPPVFQLSGTGAAGSARLFSSAELSALVGLCSGTSPGYGPDGEFCTDDDGPPARRDIVTNPLVTGLAAGQLLNANESDGNNVGPVTVSGAPFSCDALHEAPPRAAGAGLAGVSTQLQRPTTGDVVFTTVVVAASGVGHCVGDCGNDRSVTIDELLRLVNIALGNTEVPECIAGDANGDGRITVDEILVAVTNAIDGCV